MPLIRIVFCRQKCKTTSTAPVDFTLIFFRTLRNKSEIYIFAIKNPLDPSILLSSDYLFI